MIHLVTAVSRPENLKRIHRSITASLLSSRLEVEWILVLDRPLDPSMEEAFKDGIFQVQQILHQGGPCPYGINQKNEGISHITDGFFHCLDDDNLVHPLFFHAVEKAMAENPSKRAFVVGQQRWDSLRKLVASPDRMEYGQIDNTMFVVHSSLIGKNRYDPKCSGREDFVFFRNLWNDCREEFVFLNETLAYYNYLRYFPAESLHEPIRLVPPAPPAERHPKKPHRSIPLKLLPAEVRFPGVKKIAIYSSRRDRCGISTYSAHLKSALVSLGHDVRHFGSQPPYEKTFDEALEWKPDVFHFQHETSIMPPEADLEKYSDRLHRAGAKVFITLHTENLDTIRTGQKIVKEDRRVILHRPTPLAPRATVFPMPCTVSGSRFDRSTIRKKYGIPEEAFLVSTVGFLIPWKDHPKIVEMLLPWMAKRGDVCLQIIASEHFNQDLKVYAETCRRHLSSVASAVGSKRIVHVDGYPSDEELVLRLAASDLGYVWCPFDTGSSSAAAAQFTTARCPLVATDSTHYAFLGSGIVRSQKDPKAFVELIERTAEDVGLLDQLRAHQWEMYQKRNYIETARKHLKLYGDRNGA